MLRQGEDSEGFGDVFLKPIGQFRRGVAIAGDQLGQGGFGLDQIVRIPDRFQLSADAFADLDVWRMMDGVPGEVELAALPCGAAEHSTAGSAQAAVVVGDDEFDPAQPAGDETFKECPPVDLGLRQGHRHAQHSAALIRADTDSGENVRRENGASPVRCCKSDAFCGRIASSPSRTIPPWRIFSYRASRMRYLISPRGRSRQAASSSSSSLAARLTCEDDRLSMPNSAMTASTSRVDTPLMYISATASSEEDQKTVWGPFSSTERAPPALQRLRVERLSLVTGGLGDLHVHGSGRRVDAFGFGAVGIAPALGRALIMPGPEKALALASRIAGSNARANTPARSLGPVSISCSKIASTAVSFRLSIRSSPWLVCNSMEYQNGQPLLGRAPAGAHDPNSSEFPDFRLQYLAIWARVDDWRKGRR